MIKNIVLLVQNSTVMPFRWLKTAFRCFYCYDIIEEPAALKKHQETHDAEQLIQSVMEKYWEHYVLVDISEVACKHCEDPITDLIDLSDHLFNNHELPCKDIDLSKIMTVKIEDNIACYMCGEKFLTFGPLVTHCFQHNKDFANILCHICGQKFLTPVLLGRHMTKHRNTTVKCNDCGKDFASENKLLTHKINMHNKQFKCLICSEMFKSRYTKLKHMAAEHNKRAEYQCPGCPKTFVFKSVMLSHAQSHLQEKRYPCSICNYSTHNATQLKSHMGIHTGERNFKCHLCDKAYLSNADMKKHCRRTHKVFIKGSAKTS